MPTMKIAVLAIGVMVLSGCSAWDKAAICCDGGYEYRHPDEWTLQHAAAEQEAYLAALVTGRQRLGEKVTVPSAECARQLDATYQRSAELETGLAAAGDATRDRDRLAAELAAAHQRIAELETRLSGAGVGTIKK